MLNGGNVPFHRKSLSREVHVEEATKSSKSILRAPVLTCAKPVERIGFPLITTALANMEIAFGDSLMRISLEHATSLIIPITQSPLCLLTSFPLIAPLHIPDEKIFQTTPMIQIIEPQYRLFRRDFDRMNPPHHRPLLLLSGPHPRSPSRKEKSPKDPASVPWSPV
ncbi:hypothetical protein BDN72DRAFT_838404 [Pluteus cervinus]|uniref:Uncharacterized protein n=1 Tax=Pluteus cervinus TaxID=181527 RepID=A0ACD3AYI0_9AGAR|nr:hypothetical protein BDN72DRAFT_838404 [Pluteus cervinus]